MPVIKTYASTPIPEDARTALKTAYGSAIEAIPGKSEQWLMCLFDECAPIYFAGDDSAPSALVDVSAFARSEVPSEAWERFTREVTPVVARELGVDPARIYIRYGTSTDFGWNGANL